MRRLEVDPVAQACLQDLPLAGQARRMKLRLRSRLGHGARLVLEQRARRCDHFAEQQTAHAVETHAVGGLPGARHGAGVELRLVRLRELRIERLQRGLASLCAVGFENLRHKLEFARRRARYRRCGCVAAGRCLCRGRLACRDPCADETEQPRMIALDLGELVVSSCAVVGVGRPVVQRPQLVVRAVVGGDLPECLEQLAASARFDCRIA